MSEQSALESRLRAMEAALDRVGTTADGRRTAQELVHFLVGLLCEAAAVEAPGHEAGAEFLALAGAAELLSAPGPQDASAVRATDRGRPLRARPAGIDQAWDAGIDGAVHVVSVPLIRDAEAYGRLLVARTGGAYDEHELATLRHVARLASVHLGYARRVAAAENTAVELQLALASDPGRPHPNLEIASRYLPLGGRALVGGDWFETVRLHFGRTLLVEEGAARVAEFAAEFRRAHGLAHAFLRGCRCQGGEAERGDQSGAGADQGGSGQYADQAGQRRRGETGRGDEQACEEARTDLQASGVQGAPGPGLDDGRGGGQHGDGGTRGDRAEAGRGAGDGQEADADGERGGGGGQAGGGDEEGAVGQAPGEVGHGLPLAGQRRHGGYGECGPQGDRRGAQGHDGEEQAEATANAIRPPSRTGLPPMRSAREPKTGLRSTSTPSYRASRPPRTRREVTASSENPPRLAAMPCAPRRS